MNLSPVRRSLIILAVATAPAEAQFATVGAGVLLSSRVPEPIAELHAETPPIASARAYVTLSWSDESAKPTLITAAERSVLHRKAVGVGLGAGLLWLEGNDYRPYPIVVSATVVPLPVPRTAVGVTVWFVR